MHTPEPWEDCGDFVQGGLPDLPEVVRWYYSPANRARAIACVNACRGMADPEKEIARLREVERITRDAVEGGAIDEIYLSLLRDAIKGDA